MKNSKIFKNSRFKILITVMSLLSTIPFGILIFHLYQLNQISSTQIENETLVNLVLDRTISSPLILSGFIVGMIIWPANSIVSAVAVHKKYVSRLFGYTTLALGGIGIHAILLLLQFIFEKVKIKKTEVEKRRFTKAGYVASISLVTIMVAGVTSFFALGLSVKNYDSPVLGNPVEFSMQKDSPNVIEIFTDGFDQWNKEDYEADEDFNDFNWFDKFQTVGTQTHRSVPSIWGDYKKYNPFQIRKDNNIEDEKSLSHFVYKDSFLHAGIEHLQLNESEYSQRSIINTICLSDNPGYSQSTSGVPSAITKLDPKINVTNWSGARDYESGKVGYSNLSPDGNSYKYFSDSSVASATATKGTHVLLNDLITHKPYMSNASGGFTTFNTSAEDQKSSLRKNLKYLFKQLKTKEVGGINAYDNSLIIIYGDHSNHYRKLRDDQDKIVNYRHAESAMIIKYPNEDNGSIPMNEVNDITVYAASINSIINHFIGNKTDDAIAQLNWMRSEPAFDDAISRPTFIDDDTYVMTKWHKGIDRDTLELDPQHPDEVSYNDWKNSKSLQDQIGKVVF